MTTPKNFGRTLRSIRVELGLTQEAVAHAVGSTQRHLSFLENGRSAPSRAMLGRLVAGLTLSAAQRALLFAASGFHNPYPTRALDGEELQAVLDLMGKQVLRHWPFPAFVVDRDWNMLRANGPGAEMTAAFGGAVNMYALFLSPAFSQVVTNWEQASGSFYTRIQEVAGRSPAVRAALEEAVGAGRFEHVSKVLGGTEDVPVYIPFEVQLGSGVHMRFTSLHGRWVSVHDVLAEQFEVELMVPLDEASEAALGGVFGGASNAASALAR